MDPAPRMETEIVRRAKLLTCLPVVGRGCCCSLEACCMVKGVLHLLACLGMLTKSITYIVAFTEVEQELVMEGKETDDQEMMLAVLKYLWWFVLIVSSVTLLLVISLLVGLSQKRPTLLTPYIVMLYLHVFFGALVAGLGVAFLKGDAMMAVVVGVLVYIGWTSYILVCINSLRVRMIASKLVALDWPMKMPMA